MDPVELIILGLLGVAAYAFFGGASAPAASAASTAATSSSTTVAKGTTSTPGTTIPQPLSASQMPPDSAFIAAGEAAYKSSVGNVAAKYWNNFVYVLTAALSNMQMSPTGQTSEFSDNCSGVSVPNVTFSQVAQDAGIAVGAGTSIAASAGAIAATTAATASSIVGIGVAIVTLIAGIFTHHAQKVKEQAQLDCAACDAANNAWAEIQSALEGGTITLAQAYTGWEAVYSQFAQMVGQMNNMGPGDCNNPCLLTIVCRQVTNKWECMYQAAAAACPPSSASASLSGYPGIETKRSLAWAAAPLVG